MSVRNSRREFFGRAAGALATVSLFQKRAMGRSAADKPALLGGSPVHTGSWPRWPEWRQAWEPRILQVLRSGQWYRGSGEQVPRFETAYAEMLGAKRCLATASGTTALIVGMYVLDEDACQAWLAEYRGNKCGTIGDLGCFSFQNSKHLPSGEGGAITGNSDDLIDRASSFHDCGRPYGNFKGARPNFTRGGNFRMQHFQAAMLLQQFDKLREDTVRRRENAARLSASLKEIPGILPARLPENSQ